MRPGTLAHQRVALMARRGEQVGGELENRAIVVLEPAQDVHKRLLRRVLASSCEPVSRRQ